MASTVEPTTLLVVVIVVVAVVTAAGVIGDAVKMVVVAVLSGEQ